MSKKIITIREIADDCSTISSTRWAFALVVKVDIFIICVSLLAGILSYFIPSIPAIDCNFYTSVAMLLGILTGIIGTTKALQGFEPHSKSDEEVINETPCNKPDTTCEKECDK